MATIARKDKVERMLKLNKILSILVMPPLAWALLNMIWPMAGLLWWAVCAVLSIIGMYYFGLISTIIVVAYTYRAHPDKILEELEPLTTKTDVAPELVEETAILTESTIVALPENFLGTYKDFQFYEWLDLKYDDGTVRRVFFEGIADINYPVTVQKDCILLAPGLLYRHQTAQ